MIKYEVKVTTSGDDYILGYTETMSEAKDYLDYAKSNYSMYKDAYFTIIDLERNYGCKFNSINELNDFLQNVPFINEDIYYMVSIKE